MTDLLKGALNGHLKCRLEGCFTLREDTAEDGAYPVRCAKSKVRRKGRMMLHVLQGHSAACDRCIMQTVVHTGGV